jgi:hypothetical protein
VTYDQDENAAALSPRLRSVLTAPETWVDPPPGLRERVAQSLREARRTPDVSDEPGRATPDTSKVIPLAGPARRERAAARTGARRPLWLGMAAAAAVVAAVSVAVASPGGSPTVAVVALAATDLAPGASGRAEIRDTPSGFEVDLDTEGLVPAAPGTYYQAWLKNRDDQLVTIGTFHARDGGADIVLWSGVDPRDYPGLTITVQREGAGADSSGQVVLNGTTS